MNIIITSGKVQPIWEHCHTCGLKKGDVVINAAHDPEHLSPTAGIYLVTARWHNGRFSKDEANLVNLRSGIQYDTREADTHFTQGYYRCTATLNVEVNRA